jgi:hypothetical protein
VLYVVSIELILVVVCNTSRGHKANAAYEHEHATVLEFIIVDVFVVCVLEGVRRGMCVDRTKRHKPFSPFTIKIGRSRMRVGNQAHDAGPSPYRPMMFKPISDRQTQSQQSQYHAEQSDQELWITQTRSHLVY